ncbi:MAG: T9SS type A sorting domain-containing protein [Rubricoccaceae bacterium]|nr:T9SS type A sorting domain-containing protein [Rubricoccaceae bacterium]
MTKRLLPLLLAAFVLLFLPTDDANAQAADIAPSMEVSVSVDLTGGPVALPAFRGGLLYDNGPLVNSPGTGLGGFDESILQSSLGMTTLGFGHQVLNQNFVADDFEVPEPGWDINEVVTFAYQTGGGPDGSTMTQVHMCIWDGPPSTSPNLVWGDCATNVMSSTEFAEILRVSEANTGINNDRSVYAQTSDVVVSLPAGTYWLEWATDGSLGSGPWAPPITINGETTTGNGEQCIAGTSGGVCAAVVDGGTGTPQGVPFQIYGTVIVANEPGAELPEGYSVSQAYPNPFNPQSRVVVEVGETQDVVADVYNALGQRVARLYEGTMVGGQQQTLTFEANSLPSGLYMIRVDGEQFSATRMVSLVK